MFLLEEKAFGYQFVAVLGGQGGVEAAGEEAEEGEGGISGSEVGLFHILQDSVGDMGFELAAQGIVGVVAAGVTVDEPLGEGFESGDIFLDVDFAWD